MENILTKFIILTEKIIGNLCQTTHFIKKIFALFLFTSYKKNVKPNKKRKKI